MKLFIPIALLTASIVWAVFEYNHKPVPKSEYYTEGIELYQVGSFDTAFDNFEKAFVEDSSDAVSIFYMGLCKLRLNEFQEGVELCKKATDIDPELSDMYYDYGVDDYANVNIKEDNDENSVIPDDSEYLTANEFNEKGLDLYKKGIYNSALNYFKKAVAIDSSFITGYYNMGLCNLYLEKYEDMLECYGKVILMDPKDTDAYFYSAYARYELLDYQGAIDDYNSYIKLDATDYNAFRNRGLAKLGLYDTIGACMDWDKAEALGGDQSDLKEDYCQKKY